MGLLPTGKDVAAVGGQSERSRSELAYQSHRLVASFPATKVPTSEKRIDRPAISV
jgi:hypothetical protein